MQFSNKIVPCLWFASEAEEAARFYTGIFPDSRVGKIARYGKAGQETHGPEAGQRAHRAIRARRPGVHRAQWRAPVRVQRGGVAADLRRRSMVDWFGETNEKSERVMTALMKMSKLDISALEKAYEGR